MIYLDASGLVKLLFEEDESEALTQWLFDHSDDPKLTSELSTIEVMRTCRRRDDSAVEEARIMLAGIDVLPITTDIVGRAATLSPIELRSLDAIHLASALSVRSELTGFVAYDTRLQSAARSHDLVVVAPV